MSGPGTRVLVGYDGSVPAGAAIEVGAQLLPEASAQIGHLWTPPFAGEQIRRRLWDDADGLETVVEAVEREGRRQAEQVARMGVALARAAGWAAEYSVSRCYGSEGFGLAQLARTVEADLLLVGSRGLGGTKALLGSVSDLAVHYAMQPVVVAPYPLLAADHEALADGPVLVGWDGSVGARSALETAVRLWPGRQVVLAGVDTDVDPPPLSAPSPVAVRQLVSRHQGSSVAVAECLAGTAREVTAAVLVLGSRGRSAVREVVLGSVAMSTLHRAHRVVMVVPPPGRSRTLGV